MKTFLFLIMFSFISVASDQVSSMVWDGNQQFHYQSLMNEELEGWKDSHTDSTIVLDSQCGISAEFHLVGDNGRNYLLVGLVNHTNESVYVLSSQIDFSINSNGTRFPGWPGQQPDHEIRPTWWYINYIPFPSKEEFSTYNELEARIPIFFANFKERCLLKAKFIKKKNITKEQTSYSMLELSFDGGSTFSQTGNAENLGESDVLYGINFVGFLNPNHAFGVSLINERSFGGSNKKRIHDKFTKGAGYDATTQILSAQYVYRHFISTNLSLNYEPSIGYQAIRDNDKASETSEGDLTNALALGQRLMFNYRVFKMPAFPNYLVSMNLGLGFSHIYIPSEEIGGVDIDGHRLGIIFRLGFGM